MNRFANEGGAAITDVAHDHVPRLPTTSSSGCPSCRRTLRRGLASRLRRGAQRSGIRHRLQHGDRRHGSGCAAWRGGSRGGLGVVMGLAPEFRAVRLRVARAGGPSRPGTRAPESPAGATNVHPLFLVRIRRTRLDRLAARRSSQCRRLEPQRPRSVGLIRLRNLLFDLLRRGAARTTPSLQSGEQRRAVVFDLPVSDGDLCECRHGIEEKQPAV